MMDGNIRIVIVTMFEPGRGRPGELSRFREGLGLRPWKLPGHPRGSCWKNDAGVAALVAGVGPVNTAVSVMTLGQQAGVDLRHAYWLICGIGGGNPKRCSLGSPVWAEWVVDGDLAFDLHPADHPSVWNTGLLPLGAQKPFGQVAGAKELFGRPSQVFHLNRRLATWAHTVSSKTKLFDSAKLAAARLAYAAFAAGAKAPAIQRGDVLSSARFWHGARHHAWAERWIKYWTKSQGSFATASMEDSGTLGALRQLDRMKLADWRRVMLLRSVSNYTMPPPGHPAHHHLLGEPGHDAAVNFPGLEAALENAWRAGQAVINACLAMK